MAGKRADQAPAKAQEEAPKEDGATEEEAEKEEDAAQPGKRRPKGNYDKGLKVGKVKKWMQEALEAGMLDGGVGDEGGEKKKKKKKGKKKKKRKGAGQTGRPKTAEAAAAAPGDESANPGASPEAAAGQGAAGAGARTLRVWGSCVQCRRSPRFLYGPPPRSLWPPARLRTAMANFSGGLRSLKGQHSQMCASRRVHDSEMVVL